MEPSADVLLRLKEVLESGTAGESQFREFNWYRSGELAALKKPYAVILRQDSLQREASNWWDMEFSIRLVQDKCFVDPDSPLPEHVDEFATERILRFGQYVCDIMGREKDRLEQCIPLPGRWSFSLQRIHSFGFTEAVNSGTGIGDDEAEVRFSITGQTYHNTK